MSKKATASVKAQPVKIPERSKEPAKPVSAGRDGKKVTEAQVRLRAYQLWEAGGKPLGDGVAFWLKAEHELNGRNGDHA